MITRLASTMRDEFSSIIRTFTSSTVSEANEAALAIINRLVAEKSRTEAENIAIPPEVVEAAAKAAWKIYWPAIEWESLGNTRLAEMFREMATAALAAQPAPGGKDE